MPDYTRLSELPLPAPAEPGAAVPPPRFESATFESYRPANESQRQAAEVVHEFVDGVGEAGGFRWPWQARPQGRGLYLDGSYGVGKTHLLAAAFHASAGEKAYLTFQELVHQIGALGMEAARERFASVSLVCVDEFELDDPGNTLIVKRFLEQVFAHGGGVITTSNTPAEAQGQGRFNADDFRREIQGIASRFTTVSISGDDYRLREVPPRLLTRQEYERAVADLRQCKPVVTEFDELLSLLAKVHPIGYRALIARMELLLIAGVDTISSLNDALRFVHFIDQLYDRRVGLRAWGDTDLADIFHPSYRHSAYQRKFERCVSRLGELLGEPLSEGNDDEQLDRAEGFD